MKNLTKNTKTKMPKESLTWLDPQTGNTFHAGIAFYDEEHNEHRLILDGPRTIYNLKPSSTNEDKVNYKVFCPIHVSGKYSHKVEVGFGYSSSNTNGDIYITIGRNASMRLVLSKGRNTKKEC